LPSVPNSGATYTKGKGANLPRLPNLHGVSLRRLSSKPDYSNSKLLTHDLDVVGGLYPLKRLPAEFSFRAVSNDHGAIRRLPSGAVEMAAMSGGFVLVRREVYLALMEAFPERAAPRNPQDGRQAGLIPWSFYPEYLEGGLVVPEDCGFCRVWRSIGGTIWADLSIKLTHHGWHSYSGDPMSLVAAGPAVAAEAT
jgi:hypothetical protein